MAKLAILLSLLLASYFIYSANAKTFKQACLKAHNRFRKQHGVPKLVLNSRLQKLALRWAQYLVKSGQRKHRPNNKFGENIFYSVGRPSVSGWNATRAWYKEIKNYNWNKPGFGRKTGHFTQVVWRNTKRLGCGFAKKGSRIVVVANYGPRGNVAGQFKANVPKRK